MCSGSIQDDVDIFHVCSPHLPRPSTKLIWGLQLAWTQWWTGPPFSNYPKSSNQLICIYLVFLCFLQPTSRNLVTSRLHFVTIIQVSHAFIRRSSDLLLVISCYFPIQHPEWTLYLTQKIIESFFPLSSMPIFPGIYPWNPLKSPIFVGHIPWKKGAPDGTHGDGRLLHLIRVEPSKQGLRTSLRKPCQMGCLSNFLNGSWLVG